MRETGKSKTCVWRWQERFAAKGVDGLLRDKTRPSRVPKLDPSVTERVVALTMEEPPNEATHWTSAAMAETAGVSVSSVQRIWRAIPRWTFHFTPTSASWLNAIEGFFAALTKRRLKRGVFRSVANLQAAINRFLDDHNAHSKPFQWTADPDKIIAAVRRGHQTLDSIHQLVVGAIYGELAHLVERRERQRHVSSTGLTTAGTSVATCDPSAI
jgi:transposase